MFQYHQDEIEDIRGIVNHLTGENGFDARLDSIEYLVDETVNGEDVYRDVVLSDFEFVCGLYSDFLSFYSLERDKELVELDEIWMSFDRDQVGHESRAAAEIQELRDMAPQLIETGEYVVQKFREVGDQEAAKKSEDALDELKHKV